MFRERGDGIEGRLREWKECEGRGRDVRDVRRNGILLQSKTCIGKGGIYPKAVAKTSYPRYIGQRRRG